MRVRAEQMGLAADRLRLAGYGAAVFLSSAALLVVEVAAGRLLAPYVGMSLYTWTAIIGVVLAGLSLGNWLGGVWADRGAGPAAAGLALGLAGASSMGSLLVLTWVAPWLEARALDLMRAAVLYAASLFFLPALLLGIVTPLLTTLALRGSRQPGHVVGAMHALAALGSIVGTFAAGFWLVQSFGTRQVLAGTGALLLALALPFLRRARLALAVAAVAGAVATAAWARGGLASPCTRESAFFCIRVVDASAEAPWGEARALVLDHLLHGINHRQAPTLLLSPYMQAMLDLAVWHARARGRAPRAVFFVGGGAYSLPRALGRLWPETRLHVAELDPAVTAVAAGHLYVDTAAMRIEHADARPVLRRSRLRYDLVVGDAFQDVAVPAHLLTREFAALVRARLAPDGLYVLNVVDAWPELELVAAVARTLGEVFGHVGVWTAGDPGGPARLTFVVAATDAGPLPAEPPPALPWHRPWRPVPAGRLAHGMRLTDDLAPVERLIAPLMLGARGR